jgi:hypothetical protein
MSPIEETNQYTWYKASHMRTLVVSSLGSTHVRAVHRYQQAEQEKFMQSTCMLYFIRNTTILLKATYG